MSRKARFVTTFKDGSSPLDDTTNNTKFWHQMYVDQCAADNWWMSCGVSFSFALGLVLGLVLRCL